MGHVELKVRCFFSVKVFFQDHFDCTCVEKLILLCAVAFIWGIIHVQFGDSYGYWEESSTSNC